MVATNEKYDPNYIIVVFTDNLTGQFDWYFTKSTDGGEIWSTPQIAVDPDFDVMENERHCAAIAMDDNGIVHMSFARQKTWEPRDTAPTGIYYARYNGTNWSGPITIQEELSPTDLFLYTNDIFVGMNNTVHLAYGSDYLGNDNGDIWYSRSEDSGLTWTSPTNINAFDGMDVGYHPSLAADDSGYVYYAVGGDWYSESLWDEMYFRRSIDNGYSWDSEIVFGGSTIQNDDRDPWIVCDNAGGVYAVYAGNSYQTLKFKYSTDHGSNWTPSSGGITLAEGSGYFAELDDYGYIHIIYGNESTGVTETYYMKIDTSGNVIVPSQMITPDDGNPSIPAGLALTGSQVCVATIDTKDGNSEAYFLASAHWLNPCTLKIDSSPGNVDFSINGSFLKTPWEGTYEVNTALDVEMPENCTSDDLFYIWDGWLDGNTSRFRTVVLTDNITLTGNYSYVQFPPSANFTWSPLNPCTNETVSFDASSSVPNGGTIVSYEWNFGDNGTTTGKNVEHSFTDVGNYTVILNVTDSEGLSGQAENVISVHYPFPPSANFTWSPLIPVETNTAIFDASSSLANSGTIISYEWSFGDNGTGTGVMTDHIYGEPGNYSVTLNVTNSFGLSDLLEQIVTVRAEIIDIAIIGITPYSTRVIQGEEVPIQVDIQNQGETQAIFNLSIYANSTLIYFQEALSLSPSSIMHGGTLWNTSATPIGLYVISAEVTSLPREEDTADNTFVDGTVSVELPMHDIAVTAITCIPYVLPGSIEQVDVTVANHGNMKETFNITVYANGTAVDTTTVVDMDFDTSQVCSLNWDTTGFALGTYAITATASPVPGETNTGDNTFADGAVTITDITQAIYYLYPKYIHVAPNETFTIDICIFNVVGMAGWQTEISFNSSVLQRLNAWEGHGGPGTVWFFGFRSLTGSATLYRLEFKAIGEGTSDLHFVGFPWTAISDRYANPIPYATVDASVDVFLHDICLSGGDLSKTIIGKGYCTKYPISAYNNGFCLEDFNVTFYANGTSFQQQAIYGLNQTCSVEMVCSLNTTALQYGNYTLTTTAGPVPGETRVADNTVLGGSFIVTIPGDVNGDFQVDIYDAIKLAGAYNTNPTSPHWNANIDINGDNVVDIYDAIILANHYGQHYP